MYPSKLRPASVETFTFPSNQRVKIPKVKALFDKWTGTPLEDTYNNKPIVNYKNEPVFAELTILRIFQDDGWDGVWVDTYRRKYRKSYWGDNSFVKLPEDKEIILNDIYKFLGVNSGCWDVFCWKDERVIFAESKHHLKDKIRPSQIRWLEAALKFGLKEDSFLIVEWEFTKQL